MAMISPYSVFPCVHTATARTKLYLSVNHYIKILSLRVYLAWGNEKVLLSCDVLTVSHPEDVAVGPDQARFHSFDLDCVAS